MYFGDLYKKKKSKEIRQTNKQTFKNKETR